MGDVPTFVELAGVWLRADRVVAISARQGAPEEIGEPPQAMLLVWLEAHGTDDGSAWEMVDLPDEALEDPARWAVEQITRAGAIGRQAGRIEGAEVHPHEHKWGDWIGAPDDDHVRRCLLPGCTAMEIEE